MAGKKRLVTVAGGNALAAPIVEHAGRTGEVEVDLLEAELGGAARFDVVAALKELEDAGAGTFIVGRRGKKSRFEWKREWLFPPKTGGGTKPPPGPTHNPPPRETGSGTKLAAGSIANASLAGSRGCVDA